MACYSFSRNTSKCNNTSKWGVTKSFPSCRPKNRKQRWLLAFNFKETNQNTQEVKMNASTVVVLVVALAVISVFIVCFDLLFITLVYLRIRYVGTAHYTHVRVSVYCPVLCITQFTVITEVSVLTSSSTHYKCPLTQWPQLCESWSASIALDWQGLCPLHFQMSSPCLEMESQGC